MSPSPQAATKPGEPRKLDALGDRDAGRGRVPVERVRDREVDLRDGIVVDDVFRDPPNSHSAPRLNSRPMVRWRPRYSPAANRRATNDHAFGCRWRRPRMNGEAPTRRISRETHPRTPAAFRTTQPPARTSPTRSAASSATSAPACPMACSDLRQLRGQRIAQTAEQQRPADPAGHVEGREPAVGHPGHAGQERGEHAQQRHEAAEEDGLAAMALEEPAGPLEPGVVDAEQLPVSPDQGQPAGPPDPIGPGVAQHGADRGRGNDAHDRKVAGGGIGRGGEERRLAGQGMPRLSSATSSRTAAYP